MLRRKIKGHIKIGETDPVTWEPHPQSHYLRQGGIITVGPMHRFSCPGHRRKSITKCSQPISEGSQLKKQSTYQMAGELLQLPDKRCWQVPLFTLPLHTDSMEQDAHTGSGCAPSYLSTQAQVCPLVIWQSYQGSTSKQRDSLGLFLIGPWLSLQRNLGPRHTEIRLSDALLPPSPSTRVTAVWCTLGHPHPMLIQTLLSQPKLPGTGSAPRGHSYTRPLHQDWDRQLLHLIQRNKHRKSDK